MHRKAISWPKRKWRNAKLMSTLPWLFVHPSKYLVSTQCLRNTKNQAMYSTPPPPSGPILEQKAGRRTPVAETRNADNNTFIHRHENCEERSPQLLLTLWCTEYLQKEKQPRGPATQTHEQKVQSDKRRWLSQVFGPKQRFTAQRAEQQGAAGRGRGSSGGRATLARGGYACLEV